MPQPGWPSVLHDIVEEHFDELDWLWEHREANLFTDDWNLADLEAHEVRAEAHLDALRLAELHAVEVATDGIGGDERFAATASAFVLWDTGVSDLRARVLDAFAQANRTAVDGIRLAVRHREMTDVVGLTDALGSQDVFRAAAAADVLAFHRDEVGDLGRILRSDDLEARALALGAVGRTGTLTDMDLHSAFEGADAHVYRAGFEAAARCSVPGLAARCREAVTAEGSDAEAVAFLGVLGVAADVPLLVSLTRSPPVAETAVLALGAAGRVEAVPTLIELMSDAELGVAATAAYKRITGANDVEGERALAAPDVPEGEDEQEALPPDPAKAASDWSARGQSMVPGPRWQSGRAFPDGVLSPEMLAIPLSARRAVFLSARALAGVRVPDLELEALASRQRGTG